MLRLFICGIYIIHTAHHMMAPFQKKKYQYYLRAPMQYYLYYMRVTIVQGG